MKRLLIGIFLAFLIFHGISFLIFVLRMMWFPPSMMGMMMGRQMMVQHMLVWFNQSFWISIMVAGIIILIWVIKENIKNNKE
jgi:glycerol-3-phosphate acyltransferase PlsY